MIQGVPATWTRSSELKVPQMKPVLPTGSHAALAPLAPKHAAKTMKAKKVAVFMFVTPQDLPTNPMGRSGECNPLALNQPALDRLTHEHIVTHHLIAELIAQSPRPRHAPEHRAAFGLGELLERVLQREEREGLVILGPLGGGGHIGGGEGAELVARADRRVIEDIDERRAFLMPDGQGISLADSGLGFFAG